MNFKQWLLDEVFVIGRKEVVEGKNKFQVNLFYALVLVKGITEPSTMVTLNGFSTMIVGWGICEIRRNNNIFIIILSL